ncbi:hypothetical protein EPN95_02365 [Patescibacteria group bacterium]|nr:MAG: hypothetical protein EPN95_02365 [Patescibacteria group bacterium]
MGKQKKKRNKAYTGADAAITRPIITRISASNRNKFSQWWFEHKRIMKPVLIAAGVVIVIVVLIVEIVRIASGS